MRKRIKQEKRRPIWSARSYAKEICIPGTTRLTIVPRVHTMLLPQQDSGGSSSLLWTMTTTVSYFLYEEGKSWMGHEEYYCPRPQHQLLAKTQWCFKIVYLQCRGHRRHLQWPLQRLYSVRDQVKQRGVPTIMKRTMTYKVVNMCPLANRSYSTVLDYHLLQGPCIVLKG